MEMTCSALIQSIAISTGAGGKAPLQHRTRRRHRQAAPRRLPRPRRTCAGPGPLVPPRVLDDALDDLEPQMRSEEHTSELQSRRDLVCRLLLEKKNKQTSLCELACL